MKKIVIAFLFFSNVMLSQNTISKRSNGDLLTGTWLCVKCRDTTVQSISFYDTVYTCTSLSPSAGIQSSKCAYTVKKNKVFVKDADGKKRKYKIKVIDYNSLELKRMGQVRERFKKTS